MSICSGGIAISGPTPNSDREYLIEIFNKVGALSENYANKCESIDSMLEDHEERITELEKYDSSLAKFNEGRTSLWLQYKEPILILASVLLTAAVSHWWPK